MQQIRVITLVLLSAIGYSATAQEKLDKLFEETTPQERAEMQTDNMQSMLSLSEDQKTAVYDINFKYAQKMEATYKAGGAKMQRLRNMKTVAEEKDKELKTVLDKGQYKTYEQHKEEMQEAIKEKVQEKRNGN